MLQIPNVVKVPSETMQMIKNSFTRITEDHVHIGGSKYFLPERYEKVAKDIFDFKVRSDDTWVVSYPRSGTTLTQELVWMLANNCDYEAGKCPLTERFPYFDYSVVHEKWNEHAKTKYKETWELVADSPSPRFVKTHFPLQLLPADLLKSGAKVIYVARNPKDVAVSWCHFQRTVTGFNGDFAAFWDFFEQDLTSYSPYWTHVLEAWKVRDNPNMLFLFYEDLVKDLSGSILKTSKFLNKEITDSQLKDLVLHLSIDNLKKNPGVNWEVKARTNVGFIRKGIIGDWANEFTPELLNRAEKWIEKNMKNTDLKFPSY